MQRAKFVAKQNIDLFVNRLEVEADMRLRSTLWQLVVEEVDRYGPPPEQLDVVNHNIQRAQTCIRDCRDHVARLEHEGSDAAGARLALANSEHLHGLLLAHRRIVFDRLAQHR